MSRRLVITADDLGREAGTTEVILALLAEGHVTATTLICVSPAAERAASEVGELGVVPRLHVTLTSERGLPRWRPFNGAECLADHDGTLHDDPFVLGARGEARHVVEEADAQLRWMRGRRLAPEAADSHAGTLYGLHGRSWLTETLEWCARHGLAFRLPRDPEPYIGGPLPPQLAQVHERAVALADALGVAIPQTIATNRRTADELGAYERLRDDYLRRLAALPEGTSELFLHPSREDAVTGPDGVVRAWEARLLRDPVWHDALQKEGVELAAGWWD
ncbi:ChbG/HpnK family deacetylase [Nonomuraea sp. KC401]|uniref:carbohydrate deacetylase n=1 Tax=unclassified Nonomuraea TaxID=2593643 RepID=UPI0010FEED1B|nr:MULTISPECIES: ChbG/HpnK family deacetylase [unclassified Nonomuraea]NBE95943.1 ChbG/HpnK family deacetylase [Nonomuraea sp. K271]TLF76260.1 ChbG/HpnK family deacetylase [Nonomuraea sp. KC401]